MARSNSMGTIGLIAVLVGVLILVPFILRQSRVFEGFTAILEPCGPLNCESNRQNCVKKCNKDSQFCDKSVRRNNISYNCLSKLSDGSACNLSVQCKKGSRCVTTSQGAKCKKF